MKEDLLKLDKITQETRLLGRENISTDEQLFSYKESVLSQIKSDVYKRQESTLTAFYTPPEVSTAIYKVLEQMGFPAVSYTHLDVYKRQSLSFAITTDTAI